MAWQGFLFITHAQSAFKTPCTVASWINSQCVAIRLPCTAGNERMVKFACVCVSHGRTGAREFGKGSEWLIYFTRGNLKRDYYLLLK
jgi:hypothetical protein